MDGIGSFEPEVSFPDNPFNAARLFLAVMAYPELGAGQPDQRGCEFTGALWSYVVWDARKARGLRYVREKFRDPQLRPPAKRDFDGALERGRRRLHRRGVAYDLMGTQLINGLFAVRREAAALLAAGRREEAFVTHPGAKYEPIRPSLWERHTPSARAVVNSNLDRWAQGFQLNETGRPADRPQKSKDLVRRAYLQSCPVLHMAHALNHVLTEQGPTFDGWEEADSLLILLWNAETWIDGAIEDARRWREGADHRMVPSPRTSEMIDLIPRKCAE